jgi:hypothetical protein
MSATSFDRAWLNGYAPRRHGCDPDRGSLTLPRGRRSAALSSAKKDFFNIIDSMVNRDREKN